MFLIFAQNIDRGYTLDSHLTSTQNLCFGAKIRKIDIPLHTPGWGLGGIRCTDMLS